MNFTPIPLTVIGWSPCSMTDLLIATGLLICTLSHPIVFSFQSSLQGVPVGSDEKKKEMLPLCIWRCACRHKHKSSAWYIFCTFGHKTQNIPFFSDSQATVMFFYMWAVSKHFLSAHIKTFLPVWHWGEDCWHALANCCKPILKNCNCVPARTEPTVYSSVKYNMN